MANTSRVAFSPLKHVIIFGGIVIDGYGDGTYLEIKPNSDISNQAIGSDGDIHTNLIANNTGTASLKMGYDNPTYSLMRVAAIAFQTSGLFLPFSSVNVNDILDTSFSANSHIIKHSSDGYSSNASDMFRSYDIFLHNIIRV